MWAGGPDALFLKEFQKFWAARVPPGRSVPAAFWTALSELQCDANELCPRVVTAIVEAQATCREQNVLGGVCKLYSASDIKALNTKVVERNQAEHILRQGFQSLAGHSATLQPAETRKLQHDLDIDVATALLDKRGGKRTLEARCSCL